MVVIRWDPPDELLDVEPWASSDEETQNRHFRARTAAGVPVFVKAYASPDHARRERVAAALLAGNPALELVASGASSGDCWNAFRWVDLERVRPSDEVDPVELARAVLAVHGTILPTPGPELPRRTASSMFSKAVRHLATADPELSMLVGSLDRTTGEAMEVAASAEAAQAPVLLHGDAGRRNLVRLGADSEPFLVDFERAGLGPRQFDLVRFPEASPVWRRVFLEEYCEAAGIAEPDRRHLWLLTLIFGIGLVVYGSKASLRRAVGTGREIVVGCVADAPAGP